MIRTSKVAGNNWPITLSKLARLLAIGCNGTMSPYPVDVSVIKLKYTRRDPTTMLSIPTIAGEIASGISVIKIL